MKRKQTYQIIPTWYISMRYCSSSDAFGSDIMKQQTYLCKGKPEHDYFKKYAGKKYIHKQNGCINIA